MTLTLNIAIQSLHNTDDDVTQKNFDCKSQQFIYIAIVETDINLVILATTVALTLKTANQASSFLQ